MLTTDCGSRMGGGGGGKGGGEEAGVSGQNSVMDIGISDNL